jgi:immune inhibitor A
MLLYSRIENERSNMKTVLITVLTFCLLTSLSFAMPPHQRVIDMINSGQIEKPIFMQNPDFFKEKGIDQGKPRRNAALDTPTGQFKALAILVKFSDQANQVNATYFDNLIFGHNGNTVNDYYAEVSYGNLDIIAVTLPSTIGWRQVPQTYGYYVDGNYGFNSWPHNAQKLTEDAVQAANAYVDFSQYDNDGDGNVDALYIIHSGPGAEYTGDVNDIWSHAWNCFIPQYVDGVWVSSYSMEPEYWTNPNDMTCGVYCHELGHVFGLPDLYDTDYSSRGAGNWTVMAFGSWNGNSGDSPAHFDAWSRAFLGFATPINVTSNLSSVSFPAVEDSAIIYRLWNSGQIGSQYFLAENRRQTGFDSALPSAGMMIWHIDESQSGNTNEWYPGYTDNGHFKVAVEQGDGDWDLEHNGGSDSGDPFPGSTTNRTFNTASTPDSKDYNFAATNVAITNISNAGVTMTADLAVINAPAAPTLTSPANGGYVNNLRPLFDFSNSTGATVYHIQIDDNADFSSPLYNVSNLSTSQYTPTSNLTQTTYYWHVRAGNGTAWSAWTSSWSVTIDATAPSTPTGLTANGYNPSHWTNNGTFIINWTNPTDVSGISKALYKIGSAPTSNYDTTHTLLPNPPRNLTITTQGGVIAYLWLLDNAGNVNYQNRAQITLNFETTRPTGCIAFTQDTSGTPIFEINWSRGTDAGGSELAGIFDIWAKMDNGSWYLAYNDIADTTIYYTGSHGHTYYFEALNIDNAGNIENRLGGAEAGIFVDTTYHSQNYLPGDANNNGAVNGLDVTYLINYFKGLGFAPEPLLAGDANGNCQVNGSDVVYLVNYLKGVGEPPIAGNCR